MLKEVTNFYWHLIINLWSPTLMQMTRYILSVDIVLCLIYVIMNIDYYNCCHFLISASLLVHTKLKVIQQSNVN